MLETIIKGNVDSITAKLELKLDEYDTKNNKIVRDKLFYSVPYACNNIFEEDSIPKSNAPLIYTTTKVYKNLFTRLGCNLTEYDLTCCSTRKILINKTSLALLMLIYNKQFREFCNVEESKTTILRHLKTELDKYIQY